LLAWIGGAAAGTHLLADLAIAALLVLGAPSSVVPLAKARIDEVDVVLGAESREQFLARKVSDWPAIAWANDHLPPDARVALVFDWSAFLLERDSVLASVEDHTPLRYYVLTHGEAALSDLRAQGVTHAIVGRVHFLRSTYSFVDDESFARDFEGPEETVDRLLLQEAELLFEDGGTRVYAL
jgi:hypothetical protein